MGPTEETTKSNLPSGTRDLQQNLAAQGNELITQLLGEATKADTAATEATKAAGVPMYGGHVAPQAAMLPGGGVQHQQLPFNTNPVVGHRQAMQRGIVNATTGVANLVSAVSQQVEQKQTQRLAVNMERLMNATNSMDQAKQVLGQDPNNTMAQDQMKRSQAIMDEILSDDKVRKSIQKAYNISFTDPSKNNTPEHAALKQATDSFSQQFQRQLPQQMAPNQQAIDQAKLAQAQAAAVHKTIDAIIPSIQRAQASVTSAEIRTEGDQAKQTQKEAWTWDSDRQKAKENRATRESVARIAGGYHIEGIEKAQEAETDRLYDKLDAAAGKGGKLSDIKTKDLLSSIKAFDNHEAQGSKIIDGFIAARNHMQADSKKYSSDDVDAMNHKIYAAQQALEAEQNTRKELLNELHQRNVDAGTSGQPSAQSTGSTATGASKPTSQSSNTSTSPSASEKGTVPSAATPANLGNVLANINAPG